MPVYMQYGSILGDVTESSHANWIELMSAHWGIARSVANPTGSATQRNVATPRVSELVISKLQDVASLPLIQEALTGSPKTVTIDFARTGADTVDVYYSMTLSGTVITGFDQVAAEDRPSETLTLNFTKIAFKGTQMDSDGRGTSPSNYAWSVSNNAPA